MTHQIRLRYLVIVTAPDGTEMETVATDKQTHAVLYPSPAGGWILYTVAPDNFRANAGAADYMADYPEEWEENPPVIVDTVRNEPLPALGETTPFPNGVL